MSLPVRRLSLATLLLGAIAVTPPLRAQLAPPATGGVAALDRILQRLAEPRRVLMIAAHPDDEDTSLLALLSLGYGARVGYLSLSRGEGGQNLIGAELGEALGLVRTRELVAARAIDGSRQFFTRAYDFGYTRSIDEALERWPLDTLVKDAVRVIRRFRPHVIVSVFSGTPRDGHGQHQAAGLTAREAFDAAGDPSRFPELLSEEGLEPWTPLKLYRSTRFDTSSATLQLSTGGLDPRVGRTFHQIAMESRSRHRSQDMGRTQPIGPSTTSVRKVADRTAVGSNGAGETDLFDGIPGMESRLTLLADSLRRSISPSNLGAVVPRLAQAVMAERARMQSDAGDVLQRALVIAGGLVIDAVADDAEVVPGQAFEVELSLYNSGSYPLDSVILRPTTPTGWDVAPLDDEGASSVEPGTMLSRRFRLTVSLDAPVSQPFFLERPRVGSLYDWSETPPDVRGLPFQSELLRAEAGATLLGARVRMDREITYRYADQAFGEMRREVRVVPLVDVALTPDRLVWPSSDETARTFAVTLVNNGTRPYSGEVLLDIPGWPTPPAQRFAFSRELESQAFTFSVRRPPGLQEGEVMVTAIARGDDRTLQRIGVRLVEYEHFRPTPYVVPATSRVRVEPLVLPAVARVGYVRGAADRVPEALLQIGVPIEMLAGEALGHEDLQGFDAIVIGSRAYETDSALVHHNDRLLDYVRRGGLLIVQYQQYAFARGRYAPFSLDIARPHDRVTDESAPVRVLEPDHRLFNEPNRIGPADWNGWPQERGLYFASTWDPNFQPMIETADPGRPALRGGLLVAHSGRGTYVYTGLSFFRAVPVGTPGALKLFLNLLSLKPDYAP